MFLTNLLHSRANIYHYDFTEHILTSPNSLQATPKHMSLWMSHAINKADLQKVKSLIAENNTPAYINAVNRHGDTALLMALKLGHHDIARYLISLQDTNLNATNKKH